MIPKREIKFRGIPLFGKNFVHGSLVVDINEKGEETFTIRRNQNGKVSNFEVIPATVNQYTGLADVNRVDIYEGDILKDDINEAFGVVNFEDGKFIVTWENISDDLFEWTGDFIIGNIYENQELLKD